MKAPFSEPYTARHNIWEFQSIVSRRLLWWAVGNVIVGMWLQQRRSKFLRGMGMQSISWGAINAMIAVGGSGFSLLRWRSKENPLDEEIVQKEHRNLFRALWINAILDVFYVAGGVMLALTRGTRDRLMSGSGWGIVIQGTFLFVFDVIHAIVMSAEGQNDDD
ncbi:MAG: hypothetical protein AAFU54_17165 [Chloroflexota bacterium]